jgi:tetratricopeptide (TPR) repeat protein
MPVWHYVVVSGFDEERGGLYVHSGRARDRFVVYARFMRDWEKGDRSTLLILPLERSGETVHAVEPVTDGAARDYEAALGGGGDVYSLMALGNMAFKEGDLAAAERSYRRALRLDRDNAAANNNLAMVYLSQGKTARAERYAKLALKKDGPVRPYALETLTACKSAAAPPAGSPRDGDNRSPRGYPPEPRPQTGL